MRQVLHSGSDRVLDLVHPALQTGHHLDVTTSSVSLAPVGDPSRGATGTRPCAAGDVRGVDRKQAPKWAIPGSASFSTDGLGIAPGSGPSLIHASDTAEEAARRCRWFDQQWRGLPADPTAKEALVAKLSELGSHRAPVTLCALVLFHLFHLAAILEQNDMTHVRSL